MAFAIEKDWITAAGLRAVVIMILGRSKNHRCGYVAVKEGSPAFGKAYDEQIDAITKEQVSNSQVGTKSPILLFTATVNSDGEGEIRRSLDVLIDVHGGITYASNAKGQDYPVTDAPESWWFGFDCAHYMDDDEGGRPLEYCVQHCESMAAQLAALK
jgi:hypothetical protein